MKKNNNQINKNINIFTFINLYQKPMLFRIFGYESNNKLIEFVNFINKIINNESINNLSNYSKYLSYICHFCKYMQYIKKRNKNIIDEIKFEIFDPSRFVHIELNELKQHEKFIKILKQFLDFSANLIIINNNLRNNHVHPNFDPNKLIDNSQEKIINNLYSSLVNFYISKDEVTTKFVNAKQKFYFCLSFLLSHKIINKYLSHLNDFRDIVNWDKYINIDIVSFDYTVMGKWNINNYVCQNTHNNFIKLIQIEKFEDKKNLKIHYKKVWKNIYKILYFHCYQYNNEILENTNKNIEENDKYIVLYDKYTEIVNYKNIVNNSIRGIITYDKFPSYTLIIFPYKYLTNKLFNKKDICPITITHKMIFDFYFKDPNNNLFEYEHFKNFIDDIINSKSKKEVSSECNKNHENDNKKNEDVKKCFLKRLNSNRLIWGDKLSFLKWNKHFFKNKQNLKNIQDQNNTNDNKQDSNNKNEITKLINKHENSYNIKKLYDEMYNLILRNNNFCKDKKDEFIKRYEIKNGNPEQYQKNIISMQKSYSYYINENNKDKIIYAVSKKDFRYLILFTNFKDMIFKFKELYSNFINEDLNNFINEYENNADIDILFKNIYEYMWENHKNKTKLFTWLTYSNSKTKPKKEYISKFALILNNYEQKYKLVNIQSLKNTYYLDYQILYLLYEIGFKPEDFIISYMDFLKLILNENSNNYKDHNNKNKDKNLIKIIRNSLMHITDEYSNTNTKQSLLKLLKLFNENKEKVRTIIFEKNKENIFKKEDFEIIKNLVNYKEKN